MIRVPRLIRPVVLLVVFILTGTALADELDSFREKLKKTTDSFNDMRATLVVTSSNKRELEKMGKSFAETYQIKKASITFQSPDAFRVEGDLGMMKVQFITTGNTRTIRIPTVRFKKVEDISNEMDKKMTALEVGVVSDSLWEFFKVSLFEKEPGESNSTVYVLKLQNGKSNKSQLIWVDGTDFRLLQHDRVKDDGTIKMKSVYSEHVNIEGIWIPTHTEVYNSEGKLAATTTLRNIVVNDGLKPNVFD